MNLETVVKEKAAESRKALESSLAVKHVQKLLEYKTARSAEILRNLGLNSANAELEKKHGELLILNKLQSATVMSVIEMKDIRDAALGFRLRYLAVNKFRGAFPVDVVQEVEQLEKEKTVERRLRDPKSPEFRFDQHELQTKFFILAPAKMFHLETVVKGPEESFFGSIRAKLKTFAKYFDDPILFYQETDEHAILLKKWGSDFTVFRKVLGYFTRNVRRVYFSLLLAIMVVSFIGGSLITGSAIWGAVLSMVFSFVVATLVVPSPKSMFYSENNWNKALKL